MGDPSFQGWSEYNGCLNGHTYILAKHIKSVMGCWPVNHMESPGDTPLELTE